MATTIWEQQRHYERSELLEDPPPPEVRQAWLCSNIEETVDADCIADLSVIFRKLKAVGLIKCIYESSRHYVAGVPVLTQDFVRMMSFIEGVPYSSSSRPQSPLSLVFGAVYRIAEMEGFAPIGVHKDVAPEVLAKGVTEDEFVTSVEKLQMGGNIELTSGSGANHFRSLAVITPTERGFEQYGEQARQDWVDLPKVVARAIVNEEHRRLNDIAEAARLPKGVVWYILRQLNREGKLLLIEDLIAVVVAEVKPALRSFIAG